MSKRLFIIFSSILLAIVLFASNGYAKTPENILKTANGQLGVPYRYGGTTPAGFDCSGFIQYVYRQNGISLPRTSYDQFRAGKSVSKSQLKVGDLVFFNTYGSGASHVGIYAGNSKFIHASTSKGISYASINDPYYWGKRYIGARRVLPEVSPEEIKRKQEEELRKQIEALAPGHYVDVPKNHWAHEPIKQLTLDGVVSGAKKGYFNPNANITRAEAAAIITRATGLSASNDVTFEYTDITENHWAYDAIIAATASGFFDGEGEFQPNKPLTRAEIAGILANAFTFSQVESDLSFHDLSANHPYYDAVMTITSHKIMNGFDDGTFRPDENITRAQFAAVIYSVVGK